MTKDGIVNINSMGTQKEIAQLIPKQEGGLHSKFQRQSRQ